MQYSTFAPCGRPVILSGGLLKCEFEGSAGSKSLTFGLVRIEYGNSSRLPFGGNFFTQIEVYIQRHIQLFVTRRHGPSCAAIGG
jgi:hypothetical protein